MKKFTTTVKLLTASAIGFGIVSNASVASAGTLVPNQEGEVSLLGIGCRSDVTVTCIDTTTVDPIGYTVESYAFSASDGTQYGKSLLFVDDRGTEDTFTVNGFGVKFLDEDEGTNPIVGEKWFRPMAIKNTSDKVSGKPIENGRLEVGLFNFVFESVIDTLELTYFDVEDPGTLISNLNGIVQNINVTPGGNGSKTVVTLKNVTSFTTQLGFPKTSTFPRTGDGVDLSLTKVPEPGTVFSLGALAVGGLFAAGKRKKAAAN